MWQAVSLGSVRVGLLVLLSLPLAAEESCPAGTFAVGAAPPQGFEQKCVLPDGRAHGPWRIWYPDGQRMSETAMDHGREHGDVRAWWPNGQLMMHGQFIQGHRYRQARYWDMDGVPRVVETEVIESVIPAPENLSAPYP